MMKKATCVFLLIVFDLIFVVFFFFFSSRFCLFYFHVFALVESNPSFNINT